MTGFDVIVIGLGGMGTAAVLALARRGVRVLGLEQFGEGHDRGSSHGHSRIIRTAYYEHPAYVPLVRSAFQGWYALEQMTGQHLLTEVPCLSLGSPEGELIAGVRRSAADYQLPCSSLSADELARRYPPFRLPPGLVGVLEHSAGILAVDACVRAQAQAACQHGAVLHYHTPVQNWEARGGEVIVHTAGGSLHAGRLVITAGPWSRGVLTGLDVPLTVLRQVVFWVGTRDDALFRRDRFPVFICETPEGYFYGLPALDPAGLKVARHYGAAEVLSPEAVSYTVTPEDEVPVRSFLRGWLPDADGPVRRSSVCLYTLTPDRHFLIDRLPDQPAVVVATGFSGHGFKFSPVVGTILADLALDGRTTHPIELFGLGRFRGSRENQDR
jgi:sarcosine oxidase